MFTIETEENGSLLFLDVLMKKKKPSGSVGQMAMHSENMLM
jgi:hypothetical protein